jgi:hypothetical protein
VDRIGEHKNAYRIVVDKPEVKRLLEVPRLWWVDNNKMDLGEIEYCGMDRIHVAQDTD